MKAVSSVKPALACEFEPWSLEREVEQRLGKGGQPACVLLVEVERIQEHVKIALNFIHGKKMAKGTGKQLAQKKYFVGQSGLGNDPHIRMMGPEVAKHGANFIAAGMSVNRCGELGELFCTRIHGLIEEVAERVVHPGGPCTGRAQTEGQNLLELKWK